MLPTSKDGKINKRKVKPWKRDVVLCKTALQKSVISFAKTELIA
jgi:hypothetical protein